MPDEPISPYIVELIGRLKKTFAVLGEERPQPGGARSRNALSDRGAVDSCHRHDVHARVGQKSLIRVDEVRDRIATFLRVEPGFRGEQQRDVSRNPVQDAAFKRRRA